MPEYPLTISELSTEVIIWTPVGRDAQLIAATLDRAQMKRRVVNSVADVCSAIVEQDNSIILVSEEALPPANIQQLKEVLTMQPAWSDIPFVILTTAGRTTESNFRQFTQITRLGHVTMLERPLRSATLVAALHSAMRARARQFQIKEYLQERVRAEEEVTRHAEELARSNADLQRFAYVTSHDLREPLRNITAYAQLLQRRCSATLDGDSTKYLDVILGGAQRMEALTQDLLSYSRLANAVDLPFKLVRLDTVLNWAKANLERAIEESGTEVVAATLPTVLGDEMQLVQLFQNLLSNAIKYRKQDEPNRVVVQSEQVDSSWLVTFRDNGQGFHPEYQDHIFGLFKRLHGREIPGTGIGLAICKTIAQKHGGRIWAEGSPGQGASFYVALPATTDIH